MYNRCVSIVLDLFYNAIPALPASTRERTRLKKEKDNNT